MNEKPIIVGVDVGITTAIAILDIEGNFVNVISKRNWKRSEILNYISKFGKPIIIATDVKHSPKTIQYIAKNFGASLFIPKEDLKRIEKNYLVKKFGFENFVKNVHEIDALASSLKAYKKFRKIFDKIRKTLKRFGIEEYSEEVTKKMFEGKAKSIKEAIELVLGQKQLEKLIEREEKKDLEKEIRKLNRIIEEQKREISRLKNEIKILRKERKKSFNFEKKILEKKLKEMERKYQILKTIEEMERNGYLPIIKIEEISYENLKKIDNEFGLEKRIIQCNKNENLLLLENCKILALITKTLPKDISKISFPILLENQLPKTLEKNGIKFIKKDEFERILKEKFKERFLEWLQSYRKRI
ncbi:MAG: hypothetical protein B6U78_00715 [Candidatus Aenigmarchaeota archaeon ex4484_224]|nr:MAG: hypothetical protein B6U78_00715 [Candidatus Aenigmarchaeota archaeon ex4484_224]